MLSSIASALFSPSPFLCPRIPMTGKFDIFIRYYISFIHSSISSNLFSLHVSVWIFSIDLSFNANMLFSVGQSVLFKDFFLDVIFCSSRAST